jgi:hypothetical protein
MKKFEYKMCYRDNEKDWQAYGVQNSGWTSSLHTNKAGDMKFANELGNEGWELVSVVQFGTSSGYYFKRQVN